MHEAAVALGAVFEDVGQWKRARYFPRPGEDMHAAVARECRAVRGACGLFDASTLGKIAVAGPDAAEFLNRLYVNDFRNLADGRCRYGILLREDGFVYDDGVIARLARDRFHVTDGAVAVAERVGEAAAEGVDALVDLQVGRELAAVGEQFRPRAHARARRSHEYVAVLDRGDVDRPQRDLSGSDEPQGAIHPGDRATFGRRSGD